MISKKALFLYAFFAVPLSFAGLPLYIHAPDLYITQYGLSFSYVGWSLLLMRLFDAVQDPYIGYLSQKYAAHRMKIMGGALLLMLGGMLFLFQPYTGLSYRDILFLEFF